MALVWLAAVLAARIAEAHAFLEHAVPSVGSTVTAAPREIRIYFSEPIEPAFSAITLAAADGRPVRTGAAAVDPADHAQFVLLLPPLPPGRYRVSWHVVSVDTHRTEGNFTFEIKP